MLFITLALLVVRQGCKRVILHVGVVLVKYEGLPRLGHLSPME